jgi:hypothetical protein
MTSQRYKQVGPGKPGQTGLDAELLAAANSKGGGD